MKKVILGLAMVFGTMAMAQKIGVKAGGNLSSLTEDDTKSQFGYYAGLTLNAPLTAKLSIQPEVIYSAQGAELKNGSFGLPSSAEVHFNLGYINVPIMFQYELAEDFKVEAGPQFGFLTSAKAKAKYNGISASQDMKDIVNTFDFGIGLGAAYNFTPNLYMNARYTAGITDIAKNNSGDAVRNNVFQLGLGYTFK
ncbi:MULTISPECIES: porin family protein [Amniculibacterium]|jgi:opacity protein-like surface antigen|uniref:porin family protein n=1 Tax=Amniculibacterium TaxID=2715289 RepID=UPI000F59F906|nr:MULTISPECIES: porin family protein [Amniculibacterium]